VYLLPVHWRILVVELDGGRGVRGARDEFYTRAIGHAFAL